MKTFYRFLIPGFLLCLFLFIHSLYAQSGRICGVVHTRGGETFEGPIRWDKNEACWDDLLDGVKNREGSHRRSETRERRISILGLDIRWNENGDDYGASSGIEFGYLKSLERRSHDRAVLELKNGEKITYTGGSTDIGSSIREIVVNDPVEGEVSLDWEDLDMVEFKECGPEKVSKDETRLYGTVETQRGDIYKGFITWDVDELLYSDVLDGEEKDHSRKIPFGKIKSIERRSSNSAWVTLRNGDKMKLSESNDVDSENRGIVVHDLNFGWVTVEWDEFERLEILDEGDKYLPKYDDYKEVKPLSGVVYDEEGRKYEGKIRWDDDETENWEMLDGEYRDLSFHVEFSQIAQIEKVASRSAKVTLKNGNSFRLSGSNDVNDENRGIFITTADGDETNLDWEDFDRVVFK